MWFGGWEYSNLNTLALTWEWEPRALKQRSLSDEGKSEESHNIYGWKRSLYQTYPQARARTSLAKNSRPSYTFAFLEGRRHSEGDVILVLTPWSLEHNVTWKYYQMEGGLGRNGNRGKRSICKIRGITYVGKLPYHCLNSAGGKMLLGMLHVKVRGFV